MKELHTDIEINAPAERVWQLLTDFDRYPQWNPFIRSISGKPEPNAKLKAFIQPSGARGTTLRPVVLKAEPNRELRWLVRWLIPGMFYGEHIFTIERIDGDKVRFVQSEEFRGLLVPLFLWRFGVDIGRGFNEMNTALKKLAESAEA
jgi:hypothetical protein